MKSDVKFLVLAGGKGERLFPFSSVIPKCLIPVAGKPCVRWIIEDALSQGFDDIVLCINKKDELNYRYEFRDLDIKFSVNSETKGTVDELLCAQGNGFITDTFILRYGDDLTEVSFKDLVSFHRAKKAAATLPFTMELKLPVGILKIGKNGAVKDFMEKPKLEKPSWIGMAVFEPRVMKYFEPGEDIASNGIPKMLKAKERVYSFATQNNWYDVGNLEHLRRADAYFRGKTKRNALV
ncbi:MAG: nucleotidyltransferase family protein [Candidatus Bathyarchaeia archaeon]